MKRKEDHINICLSKPVQARKITTLFNDVHLINNALPEIDFNDIDTSTTFLGHKFAAPLMVGAMTGGAELAKKINRNIAEAAQEMGLGMAVGSQRAGLYDKVLADTYSIARKAAPDIYIGSNIGGAQISRGFKMEDAKKLVKMLDADAFYVHLNPAQEIVQPEGEPSYKNVLSGIKKFVSAVNRPVVVKEVGFGISGNVAKQLEDIGVSAIETAGMGGTSYSAVEYYRAKESGMEVKEKMGELFWDWGIPTAASLYMVKKSVKIPVVASGGLRNGLEIAKSIAMGASLTASAWPFLRPATVSTEEVKKKMEEFIYGLKSAMFLTGCKNIKELSQLNYVVTGELRQWCNLD
jgi:isopentenyl-diphosphate delta-isomerase